MKKEKKIEFVNSKSEKRKRRQVKRKNTKFNDSTQVQNFNSIKKNYIVKSLIKLKTFMLKYNIEHYEKYDLDNKMIESFVMKKFTTFSQYDKCKLYMNSIVTKVSEILK